MKRLIISLFCLICGGTGIQTISAQLAGNQLSSQKTRSAREYEWNSVAMAGVSFNNKQLSYSFMYGQVKRWGWYGKVKTNFNFKISNSEGYYDSHDVFWNGERRKGRLAITAGVIWNMTRPVMLYAGAGYGRRWVDWETIGKQKLRIDSQSDNGAEAELGVIACWKSFLLSAGVSLNTHYIGDSEADIAIGYRF